MDEAFEDFKGYCRIKNLSVETIKLYQYQFNVFHRFLDDETFLISDVMLAIVNSFILELRSDKHVCNDVTINTYLRGLRVFLYYCMEMDYMAVFKIRIPKVDKKLKETYTDTELNALLKKPNLKICGFSEYKIYHEGVSQIPKERSGGLVFCNIYGNKGDIIRTYQDMLVVYNRNKDVEKTSAHLYRYTSAKKRRGYILASKDTGA